MGNLNIKTVLLGLPLILQLLISGCGRNLPVAKKIDQLVTPEVGEQQSDGQITLSGSFSNLNGQKINLKEYNQKPLILIFSSIFCFTCIMEATELVSHFQAQGGLPNNVDILTVNVYGSQENPAKDARKWIDTHQVSWPVGYDPDDQLFLRYCPEGETPCIWVYHPQKSVMKMITDEFSIDLLQQETERWQYD